MSGDDKENGKYYCHLLVILEGCHRRLSLLSSSHYLRVSSNYGSWAGAVPSIQGYVGYRWISGTVGG